MTQQVDNLIVGHGIAGVLLTQSLIERDQTVLVINESSDNSASNVAAGLINPITGHRLNITEGFANFWSIAQNRYHKIEHLFNTNIVTSIDQYRLIKNSGQLSYYQQRITETQYHNYLTNHKDSLNIIDDLPFNRMATKYGIAKVNQSAVVNTKTLLLKSKEYLLGLGCYQERSFTPNLLNLYDTHVEYSSIQAKRIIFCEGHQAINNPWLNDLPFKLAKGEIVNIELDQNLDDFLNWGNWLVPSNANNIARLGASYEWSDLSFTSQQTEKLLANLAKFTTLNGHVLDSRVGIRPTTKFRIPFIGQLTKIPNAFCFNGLGSKGCLIAPYYADLLADNIASNKPIDARFSQYL